MNKMNPQVQFNLSHFIGQAVDVTNYSGFQHHIHGYSNIGTINNYCNDGNPPQATGGAQSLAVQNVEVSTGHIPSGSGVVALGYAQQQQPGPVQSYHAVFNSMAVTHISPQVQTPQVQYFSYETPCVAFKPTIVSQHVPPIQPVIDTQLPPKYDVCTVPIQNVNSAELYSASIDPQSEASNESTVKTNVALQKAKKNKKTTINSKLDRKSRRNRGEAYVSASGKQVKAKCYIDRDCACKRKCILKLATEEDRKAVFQHFWNIGNFSQQNAYLSEKITLVPTKGKKNKVSTSELEEKNVKTVKRLYYVNLLSPERKVRVCKTMFLSLHGVSNGRLDRVLQAVNCSIPYALQDRRGHHAPSNKTSEDDVRFAVEQLSSMRQHKEGNQSSSSMCLPLQGAAQNHLPLEMTNGGRKETSVKRMYGSYVSVCKENGRTPVSLWVFRRIEKTKFPQENASTVNNPLTNNKSQDNRTDVIHLPCDNTECRILTDNHRNVCNKVEISASTIVQDIDINSRNNEEPLKVDDRKSNPCKTPMSREERKAKRNSGNPYFTAAGKYKDQKCYIDKECGCKYKCIPELGTYEIRKRIFSEFWKLADFSKQNAYIAEKVVLAPVVQKSEPRMSEKFTKTCSRLYYVQLQEDEDVVRVCKVAFLQLHGVSNGRVDRVLQAVACKSPYALQDRRGHHTPKNKTSDEDIEYASSHMKSFLSELPSDDASKSSRFCLSQDFNIQKMYRLYRESCLQSGRTPVGCFVYRKILRERYNCYVRSPANKTPEEDLEYAYQHIDACMDSQTAVDMGIHANSAASLQNNNVKKFHCNYVEKCLKEGRKPIGIDVYRKILRSKLDLGVKDL